MLIELFCADELALMNETIEGLRIKFKSIKVQMKGRQRSEFKI